MTGVSFARFIEALDARPSGENFMACCPGHEDRHPSLSIRQLSDGFVLLHCFAGCSTRDRLIPLLEQRGIWPVVADDDTVRSHPPKPPDWVSQYRKFDAGLVLPENRATECYLRARGLEVRDLEDVRHHPRAYHGPTGTWWRAMVAAVKGADGYLRSVHRTFLSYSTPLTKAPIEPVCMLWRGTSIKGCAIRLAPAVETLLIGEGIESTASAMKLHGLPGWAAMSAGNLRHVELPPLVTRVVIAADNDSPGIAAANAAADRFRREGRAVRVLKPKHVKDFNDLLMLKRERYAR
jgi:hypothetical protein